MNDKPDRTRDLLLLCLFLCVLGPMEVTSLRCWECLEESCSSDSSYQNHAKRECPANFVCQKTIFRFFYKFSNFRKLPRDKWQLHRSVVRGCAAHCKHVDERPYCDAMLPNLTHPDQDMGGCVERYCCSDDLCNKSVSSVILNSSIIFVIALISVLYHIR